LADVIGYQLFVSVISQLVEVCWGLRFARAVVITPSSMNDLSMEAHTI